MTTINKRGERELSQQQLTNVIQSYLGAALFKHAIQYESMTQYHAQYLDFSYDKVPYQTNLPTLQEKYVFPSLFKDTETKQELTMHLVRILQYDHKLLCLAFDNTVTMNDQRFFILAIVFEDKVSASAWKKQYSFLTQIKVAQPFHSTHKLSLYADTTILISRPENIKVQMIFRLEGYKAEEVRIQGNNKFREKKYIEALIEYEFGLGLTQMPQSRRQRAILYANSSQCLFEMRLFQAALLYASISASIDKRYAKGVYRKFTCFLQLNDFKDVPLTLRHINEVCSSEELQKAQGVFNRHSLHHHGVFDWKEIFTGANLNFGEYNSAKLRKVRDESQPPNSLTPIKFNYMAKDSIMKHELILFCKPLIYKNTVQQKFGQNYTALIEQILTYCDYEDLFLETFQELPSQVQVQGHVLKFDKFNMDTIETNSIHAKCLRCLELEKLVYLGSRECLGIWEELYRFKQECMSNCTYIHVRGGLAVFAVRDIKEGELLTVDFLNWQTNKRSSFMMQKLGVSCDCPFCKWNWDEDFEKRSGELLYSFYKHSEEQWNEQGYQKMSLFYLWNLIYVKQFKQIEMMKEYLAVMERYPLWQCIINCLKYLRLRPKNDVFDQIKSTVKRCFEKYFKMNHAQAVELLKTVL